MKRKETLSGALRKGPIQKERECGDIGIHISKAHILNLSPSPSEYVFAYFIIPLFSGV
jgi:hypothetical protein